MADQATVDPADADPISQTFIAGNALNAKQFIDQQLQLSNIALQNAISFQQQHNNFLAQMNSYSLQAMQRSESMNNAILTRATKALLDPTSDGVSDGIQQQIGAKIAQTTPPDTSTLTTLVGQLAGLLAGLTAVVQQANPTKPA